MGPRPSAILRAMVKSPRENIIGYRRNGSPIYGIGGGSQPTGDPSGTPDGDGDLSGSADEDTDDDDTDDTTDDEDGSKPKNPRIKELSEENKRKRLENKQLKKQLEEQAARLKAIEDKDKSELERTAGELDELKKSAAERDEAIRDLRLENAFLASNKFTWHDPADALKLADLSEVEIDDDGRVTGLDKALEKLAKAKPHLVKKDEGTGGTPPPSGEPRNPRTPGKADEQTRKTALRNKYPSLRRGRVAS